MLKQGLPIRFLLLVVFLFGSGSVQRVESRGLTVDDLLRMKSVSQAAIGPAGDHIAYVVRTPRDNDDDNKGQNCSEIWVVPTANGEPRQYTSKPTSSYAVEWSPDGKLITFLSKRKTFHDETQVYSMPVDGGGIAQVTEHKTGISSYRWSPDGKQLAFLARDSQSEEEKKDKEKGRDWIVVDQNFKFTRPWILDIATGESSAVYEGDLNTWSFIWTPDSAALIIQATGTPLMDASFMKRKIYRATASGGTPAVLCATVGKLGEMALSPDGSRLAFTGAVSLNDPLAQSVFVASVSGGSAPQNLTASIESSAESLQWIDKNRVLVLSNSGTTTELAALDASTGARKVILEKTPVVFSMDVSTRSQRVAMVASTAAYPGEVHVFELGNGKLERRTSSNPHLAEVELAPQKTIEWKGRDGQRIEGVVTYPLGFKEGTRYPLVLQLHGGPEGVSHDCWTTRATYPVQILAVHGFMVLEPNYRGSGGRGVAFSKGDHDDLGGAEFDDVLAGIDALIERGLVDGERVGTGGWSYGGYFSAWAGTRHTGRFKAAIMAAGISNWISFAGTTDIPHEMALVHWNSYWYDQPELHWERSPLRHINSAKTPMLIVHGKNDDRVPLAQSLEIYTALKMKKVPTELVLYPREPHGVIERAHQRDFVERTVAWFEKYLKK